MSTAGEIAIQAALHPSGRWVTIPRLISGRGRFSAVLDTGSPVSAISPRTERVLLGDGLLQATTRPGRYRLGSLTAQNQQLPELDVGVIRRLDRLDIDGLLGLDFLTHFEHIHFHTGSVQLVLERAQSG